MKTRMLLARSPMGIFVADIHGNYLSVNKALARMFGYTSVQTFMVDNDNFKTAPYQDGRIKMLVESLEQAGSARDFEVRVKRPDGMERWLSLTVLAAREDGGPVTHYEGFVKDISKRKYLVDAYHERVWFVRSVMDAVPTPIFYRGSDGRVKDCNLAFQSFFELDRREVLNKTVSELFSKDFAQEVHKQDARLMSNPGSVSIEASVELRGGDVREVMFSNSSHTSMGGDVVGLVSQLADITERKRMEEAVRQAEMKYREIFNNAPVGIFHTSIDGTVIDGNSLLSKIFLVESLQEARVKVPDIGEYLYEDASERRRLVKEAVSAKGFIDREIRMKRYSGEIFPARIRVRAARDEYGRPDYLEGMVEDLSAQRRAERHLAVVQERYKTIFVNAVQGICEISQRGHVFEANPAMARILGYDGHEQLIAEVSDFLSEHIDDQDVARGVIEKTEADGMISAMDLLLRKKTGDTFWGHVKTKGLFDESGRLERIHVFMADITERKKAEMEIRRSEATSNVLLNAPEEAIVLLDTSGKVLRANRVAGLELGVDHGGMEGQDVMALLPEDSREVAREVLGRAVSQKRPVRFQYKIRGQYHDYHLYPILEDDGGVSQIAVFMRNVTEQRKAEEALLASEARYRRLFEDAVIGIFRATPEGQVYTVNPAYARMFGFDTPMDLAAATPEDELAPGLGEALEGEAGLVKRPMVSKSRYSRHDGTEFIGNVHVWPVYDEAGDLDYYEGFVEDITDLVQAEEESKIKEQQLIQADKMISLGILTTGVAHEINNPNHLIMMNTPILSDCWDSAMSILDEYFEKEGDFTLSGIPYSRMRENVPKLLGGISEGSERIRNIVRDMKDFARQDVSSSVKEVDVNSIVEASCTLLANKIKKSTNDFQLELAGDVPGILGNYQRIEQVVVNLIINALDSLPEEGKGVHVSTGFDTDGKQVLVTVRDQGKGIDPDHLKRIFDPFFTTKREKGGIGLGLAISLSIAKAHGGSLEYESEPGHGTTACLVLPAMENDRQEVDDERQA